MFLLTEGTLFFLDLALNARACNQKPSLSSVVQKWMDGVAVANDDTSGAQTATGSSTLYVPPPVHPLNQTSSHRENIAPSRLDDVCAGEVAMRNCGDASVGASEMDIVRFFLDVEYMD